MLNSNKTGLSIFQTDIEINKKLPKWVNVEKAVKKLESNGKKEAVPPASVSENGVISIRQTVANSSSSFDNDTDSFVLPNWSPSDPEWALQKDNINYDYLKNAETGKLNVYISKGYGQKLLSQLNSLYEGEVKFTNYLEPVSVTSFEAKDTFLKRLFGKKKDTQVDHYELDIFDFFRQVKGITKESAKAYKDRVDGYIIALKNAELTGQEALCEKLLRSLIINRYESVLYANGFYYVITEEQAVNFAKKCEKGVSLDYVKNYVRVIPNEVVKKMNEMNKYEIFDNYVIMHYDPDKKAISTTIKEQEKKRDPILFGVIRGSKKLYYITDWEDDYCNLTLDRLAEVLKEDKEKLKLSKEIKI